MRARIVLDEQLLRRARELTGIQDENELIEEALRTLVRVGEQRCWAHTVRPYGLDGHGNYSCQPTKEGERGL
ncbi:MAG: type II toxin-antitoxin system VapB family antitoxin [Anaerolineales bacterium]|nr:type II toxin-antitoxin system VapB family antitoxin [Anaerolineales bacterium]